MIHIKLMADSSMLFDCGHELEIVVLSVIVIILNPLKVAILMNHLMEHDINENDYKCIGVVKARCTTVNGNAYVLNPIRMTTTLSPESICSPLYRECSVWRIPIDRVKAFYYYWNIWKFSIKRFVVDGIV